MDQRRARARGWAWSIAAGLTAAVSSGCATTIVTATTATTVPPTTTVPAGDMSALMENIVVAAGRMGAQVADGDTDAARAQLEAARANWAELEPLIVASGIDAVEAVQSIVDLMTTSVERKRPADADKAYRFGLLMLDSFNRPRG